MSVQVGVPPQKRDAQPAVVDVIDPGGADINAEMSRPCSNFNVFLWESVISCSHLEKISKGTVKQIRLCMLLS